MRGGWGGVAARGGLAGTEGRVSKAIRSSLYRSFHPSTRAILLARLASPVSLSSLDAANPTNSGEAPAAPSHSTRFHGPSTSDRPQARLAPPSVCELAPHQRPQGRLAAIRECAPRRAAVREETSWPGASSTNLQQRLALNFFKNRG